MKGEIPMLKSGKRVISLCLAVFIAVCSFADIIIKNGILTLAAGEYNYVANNGDDALNTVKVQTGGTDYVEVHAISDASKYGKAFSVYPKAAGADKYYSVIDYSSEEGRKLGKTRGIAFYAKLPEVSVSTIKVALRLNGINSYTVQTSGSVGYIKDGQDPVWEVLSPENGVLSGKSGFEGFVFLPYESFKKEQTALEANVIENAENVQLMLAVASTQTSDYSKEYVFDECGFYEHAASYVRGCKVQYGTEYVANSGDNADETVKLAWNCTDGQMTYSQLNDPLAPYGKAIGLTTGDKKSGWNNYKTGIVVRPESSWKISATTGFAFYCELPDVEADTAMDIWWYVNDECFWNELNPGKPIYYLESGSSKLETVNFSWSDYSLPGHNHSGFKGFIFVPFDSLKSKYSGEDRKRIDSASYFEMRVGIARTPEQAPQLSGQTFVFDEIGLYTEPFAYVEAVRSKSDMTEYEMIVCDGSDALNSVKLPGNYTGVTVTQEGSDMSSYGKSIGITTASSGWNQNKAGIILDTAGKSLDMSNGIAFYAKVPDVGSLDTALDIWLWNTDRYCWNELKPGSNIYYIEQGSSVVTAVEFQWGDYSLPLHNKSGFEGFVFIPFSAFKCTWADNGGKDLEIIRSLDKFEIRFNVARTDKELGNKTFVFDELGFYRDPLSYVAAAQIHREYPLHSDVIANNCSAVAETVTVPASLGGGKVVVSQLESGITPYGAAMKMTTGNSGWSNGKVRVNLEAGSDYNMSASKGVAFYVKVPAVDENTDPCLDVWLYKNDSQFWNELEPGKPIYYLEKGSDTVTSELFSWSDYSLPLHSRSGFEGFVFLPFDSFKEKYSGADREYINSAKNLQLWFNVAKTSDTLANKTYVFDEFGFYSDELTYASLCAKNDGAETKGMEYLANSADSAARARVCGTTDTLKLTQLNDAVKMGEAYTIYPEKEGANNYWVEFDMPDRKSVV